MALVLALAEILCYLLKQIFLLSACIGEVWVFSLLRLYYPAREIVTYLYHFAINVILPTYTVLKDFVGHLATAEYYIRHFVSGTFRLFIGLIYLILSFLWSYIYWFVVELLPAVVPVCLASFLDVGTTCVKVAFDLIQISLQAVPPNALSRFMPKVLEHRHIILGWFLLVCVILLSMNWLYGLARQIIQLIFRYSYLLVSQAYVLLCMIVVRVKVIFRQTYFAPVFFISYCHSLLFSCYRQMPISAYNCVVLSFQCARILVFKVWLWVMFLLQCIFPTQNHGRRERGNVNLAEGNSNGVQQEAERSHNGGFRPNGSHNPDLSASGLCIICLERPRQIVFQPCLHLCLCTECSQRLPNRQCPICRQRIRSTLTAYV